MASKGKVVLFHPRNLLKYNNYPSLGLIVVGSALEANGFDVRIISQVTHPLEWEEQLRREAPEALLVGITAMTTEIPGAVRAARILKQISKAPIVFGGWHPTLLPEQTAASDLVDYVIAGEGDFAMVQLAEYLSGGPVSKADLQLVNEKLIFAPKMDCDLLPNPNYDLWPNIETFVTGYLTDRVSDFHKTMRWLPYESSRGCPQQCTFCEIQSTENWKFRPKSSRRVVEELVGMVNKYQLTHVKIVDDNMPVAVKRMEEIAEGIIASGVKFTYDVEVRANYFRENRLITHQVLERLKESGLRQCTLGLESGSQRVLDLMKKGLKVEDSEQAVRMIDAHGIIARCSFITGYLGETKDDLMQTAQLINRLRRYKHFTCGVQSFRPYPRTPITEQLRANNLFYEPQSLEEWTNPENVAMFTYAELDRRWQPNWQLAGAVSFYNSIESGIRLGKHMLKNPVHRLLYESFASLAKIRNRLYFYGYQVDRALYHRFHQYFFNKFELEYTD